jgi:hypothetical protein
MSNWEHVSSRLGNIQPATRAIAKEIYDAAAAAGHEIWFMWGIGPSHEHSSGRALDLMVRNKAAGDWIYNYVWANRARLRLRHIIWWQSITSTAVRPGVRRPMASRGNATLDHKDHPHILVEPGAYQPPPRPAGQSTGTTQQVRALQRELAVAVDGKWGPKTDERARRMRGASRAKRGWPNNRTAGFNVRDVQTVIGTHIDGIWGPLSQAALAEWIKRFQRAIGVRSDGWWGPITEGRFQNLRRRHLNRW